MCVCARVCVCLRVHLRLCVYVCVRDCAYELFHLCACMCVSVCGWLYPCVCLRGHRRRGWGQTSAASLIDGISPGRTREPQLAGRLTAGWCCDGGCCDTPRSCFKIYTLQRYSARGPRVGWGVWGGMLSSASLLIERGYLWSGFARMDSLFRRGSVPGDFSSMFNLIGNVEYELIHPKKQSKIVQVAEYE